MPNTSYIFSSVVPPPVIAKIRTRVSIVFRLSDTHINIKFEFGYDSDGDLLLPSNNKYYEKSVLLEISLAETISLSRKEGGT